MKSFQLSLQLIVILEMKLLTFVVGLTLIIQLGQGSWLDLQVDDIRTNLLKPLEDITDEFKSNQEKLKEALKSLAKQKEDLENVPSDCKTDNLNLHSNFLSNWDMEGCLDLTGDWEDGILLGFKIGIYGVNISNAFEKDVDDIVKNCVKVNIVKRPSCYYKSIKDLVNQVEKFKNETQPYMDDAKAILKNMQVDFDKCFGIPKTLKEKIDKHIENCKQEQ